VEKRFVRTVDLHGGSTPVRNVRYIRGDVNVYPLELHLVAWNEPFVIPDNTNAFISFTRPDGVVDKAPADIVDANKGHVAYKIKGSEISVVGELIAQVEVATADQLLTFEQVLAIEVLPDPNDQTVEVPSEYSLWVNGVNQEILRLTELIGSSGGGGTGSKGDNGWSSILGVVSDGERQVLSITAWTGGTGTKPALLGYLGSSGVVQDISQAIDIKGAKGKDGADGVDGINGADGINGTDGTNGTNGVDGADGEAATIVVGSTVTVAAGTEASVTNTGTASNAILDFAIPKGEPGEKGDKGDVGASTPTIGFVNERVSRNLPSDYFAIPITTDIGTVVNGTEFVIPKSGLWMFSINGLGPSSALNAAVYIRKNGLNIIAQRVQGANPAQIGSSGVTFAEIGDVITFWSWLSATATFSHSISGVYLGGSE